MRLSRTLLVAVLAVSVYGVLRSPAVAGAADYSTVFYRSGNLQIEAYLYKAVGEGPFSLVIYNHSIPSGYL
jgi:hypothetical protein